MIAYLVAFFDSFEEARVEKVYLVRDQKELLSILDMESNECLSLLKLEKLPAVQSSMGAQNEIKSLSPVTK